MVAVQRTKLNKCYIDLLPEYTRSCRQKRGIKSVCNFGHVGQRARLLYSDDISLNPAEVSSVQSGNCLKRTKINKKSTGMAHLKIMCNSATILKSYISINVPSQLLPHLVA